MTRDHLQLLAQIVGGVIATANVGFTFWISIAAERLRQRRDSTIGWRATLSRLALLWIILGNLLILGGGGTLAREVLAHLGDIPRVSVKSEIGIYLGRGILFGVLGSILLFGFWQRRNRPNSER